jgi:hypothetical protein
MEKETNKPVNIELRSDEVQELMGRVPPYIQRIGISVILLIVIGFFVASTFIKYPTYIPVKARVLPNDYFEVVLCPRNGTIVWVKKYTVSLVHPNDTLCLLLTEEKDTIAIQSNSLGKANSTDILEKGMTLEANSRLFIIEKDVDAGTIGSDICVYLPEEDVSRYSVGSSVSIKIDGKVYEFNVTALTFIANNRGECAMKCHSNTLLPLNLLSEAEKNVELLVEDKTIFDTFFKERLFH